MTNAAYPPFPDPPVAPVTGGQTAMVDLPVDGSAAAPAIADALRSANVNVTGWTRGSVSFERTQRSIATMGTRVRYRGQALLTPVPGGTRATLSLKLAPFSYALAAILIGLLLTVLSIVGNADAPKTAAAAAKAADPSYQAGKALGFAILPLVAAGIGYFVVLRGTAKRLAEIASTIVQTVGSRPMTYAAPAPAASDGMVEQLRRLAELRDQGVLAAGEFDQAKAALLAKLA